MGVNTNVENSFAGNPIKRFFHLLKPEKKEVFYIYVYAILSGLLNLSIPLGIQAIITLITAAQVSTSWTILTVLVTIGVVAVGGLQIMQQIITERIQQTIFARTAFDFSKRLSRLPLAVLRQYYPGYLSNRFFEVVNIQKGLPKILIDLSAALLQLVFGIVLLSFYHSFFVFFGVLLILILALIFMLTWRKGFNTSMKESKFKYAIADWLEGNLRSAQSFKHTPNEVFSLDKTDYLVTQYLKSRREHFKVLLLQYRNIIGFKTLVTSGLLVLGSILVIQQQINLGQFVASEIIILLVIASAEKIISSIETIYDLLTAVEKLGYVTDLEQEYCGAKGFESDKPIALKLEDVEYQDSENKDASLHNISFTIQAGQKVCVAGTSISGVSTLMDILGTYYHPMEGKLLYNGFPQGQYSLESLRAKIGMYDPRNVIFEGTLEENIKLGRSVDDAHFHHILRELDLMDFVESQPLGTQSILPAEGRTLTESVRLRILLAQALIHKPQLLLLEDDLPLLDKEARAEILNLKSTLVIHSQRVIVAQNCDYLILLHKGKIAAQGTYAEVSQLPIFRTIFLPEEFSF